MTKKLTALLLISGAFIVLGLPLSAEQLPAPTTPPSSVPLEQTLDQPAPPLPAVTNTPGPDVHLSEFNPVQMVVKAVPVVQGVVAGLILASLLSWTLLFGKSLDIFRKSRSLRRTKAWLANIRVLADALGAEDPLVCRMVMEAQDEVEQSAELVRAGIIGGLQDRAAARLQRIEDTVERRMSRGLGTLATIGSVTPFIGLFGTVWGIMHSFIEIARANTTSLAVVAPGISEALLATAIGLLAAIPATIMYNSIGKAITSYRAQVTEIITMLLCLVSRDAERAQLVRGQLRDRVA